MIKPSSVLHRLEEKLPALADQLRADVAANRRRKGVRTITRTHDGAQIAAETRRNYAHGRGRK
jgi:hypothetical protein